MYIYILYIYYIYIVSPKYINNIPPPVHEFTAPFTFQDTSCTYTTKQGLYWKTQLTFVYIQVFRVGKTDSCLERP